MHPPEGRSRSSRRHPSPGIRWRYGDVPKLSRDALLLELGKEGLLLGEELLALRVVPFLADRPDIVRSRGLRGKTECIFFIRSRPLRSVRQNH